MKRVYVLLLLGSVIILVGCDVREEKKVFQVRDERTYPVLEKGYTPVQEGDYVGGTPENLCPFTVDIYPEVLYVGDPLYVRLNFQNNTDRDAYAYANRFGGGHIERYILEVHLKGPREMIPWIVAGLGGISGGADIWQKIEPGKEGLMQYLTLDIPGTKHRWFLSENERVWEQWEKIRSGRSNILYWETAGQIVVVINNGGYCLLHEDISLYARSPKPIRTVMSASSPIVIKNRPQSEMGILEARFALGNNYLSYHKQNIVRDIPKLTEGTLQNLLLYQVMLLELWDVLRDERDKSGTPIFTILEKIESFLKPLHEIERENLKLYVDVFFGEKGGRHWLENAVGKYGEELLEKFNDVFGKTPPPIKKPADYRGFGGS